MPLPGFLGKIFSGGAGNIVESVGKVIDNLTISKEEKAQINAEIQKEVNRHVETMTEHANKATEMYLKDVADARAMQIAALNQSDKFAKRFIYFLAAGVVTITMLYDFLFFYVEYPAKNHDIINMIAGVLNTSCLVMILSFFFGSSKSSDDKQKQMEKMMEK